MIYVIIGLSFMLIYLIADNRIKKTAIVKLDKIVAQKNLEIEKVKRVHKRDTLTFEKRVLSLHQEITKSEKIIHQLTHPRRNANKGPNRKKRAKRRPQSKRNN